MIERDVTVAGVRIHYTEEGAGDPPLLLIHGLGSASTKFYPSIPRLAPFRRTIAMDLPGFGRSDAPRATYTPAWQAGGVRAFCDALGIERAIVVGNSYGGLIATWFAAAWPERTAAAALVAPAFPNDGPPSKGGLQFMAGTLPFVGPVAQRYYWTRDPAAVVAESMGRNCVDPSRVDAGIVRLLEADAARKAEEPATRRAALAAQRAVLWAVTGQRERTWRTLSSLAVPTVLIWGEQDRVVPVQVGLHAASRLPGAHLIVIDDCGHNPQMERPEAFSDALISFIRAAEATPPDPDASSPVHLSEYDMRWPLVFETEAARIRDALDGVLVRIEHVGSTSVPGLAAKPTIDIAATVSSMADAPACVEALARLGYEYEPRYEQQIPHRRYFRKGPPGARDFHLHLYEDDHPDVDDYLAFRDRLRADPVAAREYEQLKHRLAQTLVRADYTDAKSPFIRGLIDAMRDG